MKKLKLLFGTIIFASMMNMLNAQTYGSWILPSHPLSLEFINQVVFDPDQIYTITIESGGINLTDDKLFSAGGYNDDGDLLFYIVDNQLIDVLSGYNVGNFIIDEPVFMDNMSPEVEIIKVPGSEDNSYFIFYVKKSGGGGPMANGFCYTEVEHDEYQTLIGGKEYYDGNNIGYGAIAIGEEKVVGVDIERDLYSCSSEFGIRKRTINSLGVDDDYTFIVDWTNNTLMICGILQPIIWK